MAESLTDENDASIGAGCSARATRDVAVPADSDAGHIVRIGRVAVIATLVRVGSKPAARRPYRRASWKSLAGKQGSEIDDVIDIAWPR